MRITGVISILLATLPATALPGGTKLSQHPLYFSRGSHPPIGIPNARVPLDQILTGGPPTFEQLKEAKNLGFKTIIDLRTPSEIKPGEPTGDWIRKLGLNHISLPVNGGEGVTVENAKAMTAILNDPSHFPMILHCATGNRVGALIAMKAHFIDGKSVEEAVALGKEAGLLALEPAVRERMKGSS